MEESNDLSHWLDRLPDTPFDRDHSSLATDESFRQHISIPDGHMVVDCSSATDAVCIFYTSEAADNDRKVSLCVDGEYRIEAASAGGWLLLPADLNQQALWLPSLPKLRQVEQHGRILREKDPTVISMASDRNCSTVTFQLERNWRLDWVVWHVPQSVVEELTTLSPIEQQPYMLWGSHTLIRRPADAFIHLINGWVYENRYSWPHNWKICSENDAHSLFVLYSGLQSTTGKQIYGLFKQELLLAVISRQADDGGWYHGTWTSEMESHYRLHCSGMHMLMDALAERSDRAVDEALRHAAEYIAGRQDRIDSGTWFVHDSLEHTPDTIKHHPGSYVETHVLGKSPTNLLVLNTHLDTLIALERFGEITGSKAYSQTVESACHAARSVIELRPASWAWKLLFKAVYLTWLPSHKARTLPLGTRAIKRIAWKYLIPNIHHMKRLFPRLVMPGGYIERAVASKGLADTYQTINLMDMLRYARRFPAQDFRPLIDEALEFTRNSGIVEYWSETPAKQYAIGFWVESLVHACHLFPDRKYRLWLADAALLLYRLDLGLPPSVLGANAEICPLEKQFQIPILKKASPIIINLSCGQKREFLLLNPQEASIYLSQASDHLIGFDWHDLISGNQLSSPPECLSTGEQLWAHC